MAGARVAGAATTPLEWEAIGPLPYTVNVVDADTGDRIGDAALALVGHGDGDEIVPDRSRTNTAGNATLIVPIQIKLQGTLYEICRRPKFEIVDLGLELEADAEGYESASEPLESCLSKVAHSVDRELPEITIALQRRSSPARSRRSPPVRAGRRPRAAATPRAYLDRKSTRLNSSHQII